MPDSAKNMFRNAKAYLVKKMHTKAGRNLLTYLVCVLAAFVVWIIITLDEETERDFQVPVELVNVPDNVVLLEDVPHSINAVIKGRGTQFLKFSFGKGFSMKIDFRQYSGDEKISVSRAKLDGNIREIFGQNINILALNPDSVSVPYTYTDKGVRLPLVVNSDISTGIHSVISGDLIMSDDSVMVYSISDIPTGLTHIETEPLVLRDVSDTTTAEVKIKQIKGMKILPERVSVTVPAEMLIAKTRTVPVHVTNIPEGSNLITFPANVDVEFYVPMHLYNRDVSPNAIVDYNTIKNGSLRAKVNVSALPDGCRMISSSPDSVEYYIEKKE